MNLPKKFAYFWQKANTFLLISTFPDTQRKKSGISLAEGQKINATTKNTKGTKKSHFFTPSCSS